MVARRTGIEAPPGRVPARLPGAWRRLPGGRRWRLIRPVLPPGLLPRVRARDATLLCSRDALMLGLGCLMGGASLRIGIASAGGEVFVGALATGVLTVALALLRWGVLSLKTPGLRGKPFAIRGAWAWGLLPWTLAASPWLSTLAWGLSAVLTYSALLRLGESTSGARAAVAWAWASTVAVVAVEWIVRSAWVVALAG